MAREAANIQRKPVELLPLCVDLDGTLAVSDTFYASVFSLLGKNFLFAFLFPFWLLRGKAYVKQQVSKHSPLQPENIAFNDQVLHFLRAEHSNGRALYLTSGTDQRIANLVADHLKIFSAVIASDGVTNVTGKRKSAILQEKFGAKGFDYIANAPIDLDVWQFSNLAYVVSDSAELIAAVRAITPVAATFAAENEGAKATLADYVSIARPDHWFKNIFILPGVLLALFFFSVPITANVVASVVLSVLAACFVASSNYVINEILDAEKDRHHPVKKHRPLAAGRVSLLLAYIEWIALALLGVGLGFIVNVYVGGACLFLWIMGGIYNIPPVRTKEQPFLDVLSESINNPIRMAIGWYSVVVAIMPPISALFAYWMFGAFLMATKRFAEYRRIGNPELAAQYRGSFRYYNEEKLIVGSVFYVALFITGSVVFMMLYRLELVFAVPFVAYLLAYYLYLGFQPDSPVQYPELLYREKHLTTAVLVCSLLCIALFFIDVPAFRQMFVVLTPR